MLNLFQNEWDALMLEMHQLRQALGTTRQELSYTLYMQDAATRVIARQGLHICDPAWHHQLVLLQHSPRQCELPVPYIQAV